MKKIAIIILAISAFATLALGCKLFLINQEKEKWETELEISEILTKDSRSALDYVRKMNEKLWNNEVQQLIWLNNQETRLSTSEKKEILEIAQILQNEYPELNIEISVSQDWDTNNTISITTSDTQSGVFIKEHSFEGNNAVSKINDEQDFIKWYNNLPASMYGTVNINADLDFSKLQDVLVAHDFYGTFNGNNHTIFDKINLLINNH